MNNPGFTAMALSTTGLLATCLLVAGTPESQADPKPIRVAVVNLKECFKKDRYERMKVVHTEITKLRTQYRDELEALGKKASNLKERLDAVPPGTDLARDLFVQYRMVQGELKLKHELNQYALREKSSDMIRSVYNEIRRVVKLVGKEHKYDLILRLQEPETEGEEPLSIKPQTRTDVVLYQDPKVDVIDPKDMTNVVDITEVVVKRLNEEWAKKVGRLF